MGLSIIHSYKWVAIEKIATQVFRFIFIAILARFLSPADFGVVAIAGFFVMLSEVFVNSGFTHAYIRENNRNRDELITSLAILNFLFGFAIFAIIQMASSVIGEFYNDHNVNLTLQVLSIIIIIDSVIAIIKADYEKKLDFSIISYLNVIAMVISMVFGIVLAFKGLTYWSLVVQTIAHRSIYLVLALVFCEYKFKWRYNPQVTKSLFLFGWTLQLSAIINIVSKNTNTLIIGKFAGSAAVGFYSRAQSLQSTISQVVIQIIERVTFPELSNISENSQLVNKTKINLRYFSFLVSPIVFLCSYNSDNIIYITLGGGWSDTANYFEILIFTGILRILHSVNLTYLKVIGKVSIILYLRLIEILIVILLLIYLSKYGILAMVWGQVAILLIMYPIIVKYTLKYSGYGIKEQLTNIFPFVSTSFISYCALILLDVEKYSTFLSLTLSTVLFLLFYFFALHAINNKEYNSLKEIIFKRIKR